MSVCTCSAPSSFSLCHGIAAFFFFLVCESRVLMVCVCLCISIIVKWCVFIRDIKHLNQVIALMCMLLFVVLFWICLGAHLALLYALSLSLNLANTHYTAHTTFNRALKLIINRWMRFARFVLSMCIDSMKERIMVLIFSFSNHPSLTSFLSFSCCVVHCSVCMCVCWIRSLIHYCVCIKEIYGVPNENHYLIQ